MHFIFSRSIPSGNLSPFISNKYLIILQDIPVLSEMREGEDSSVVESATSSTGELVEKSHGEREGVESEIEEGTNSTIDEDIESTKQRVDSRASSVRSSHLSESASSGTSMETMVLHSSYDSTCLK
jgi:hypothetical protein